MTFFGFYFLSSDLSSVESLISSSVDLVKVVPYLVIIVLSLLGLNVFLVLFIGIAFVSVISIFYENLQFLYVMKKISEGFLGMGDLIFLSILTGGVSFIVIKNGGFKWILVKLKTLIRGRRSAEFAIASLASVVDIFLANNTIAISYLWQSCKRNIC